MLYFCLVARRVVLKSSGGTCVHLKVTTGKYEKFKSCQHGQHRIEHHEDERASLAKDIEKVLAEKLMCWTAIINAIHDKLKINEGCCKYRRSP